MSCVKFATTACLLLLGLAAAQATTYYVDGMRGDDAASGALPREPLKSIQAAADKVNPGDTVVVRPGAYYESVAIRRFGTREKPITFMADSLEKNRVIITGARRAIREKKVPWRLDDPALGLYSIPCEGTDYPSRVLYSGADLYPYASVDLLRRFNVVKAINDATSDVNPGPRHGYTWVKDEQRLYVRLHDSGRFGSRNPNDHIMSVGPEPDGVHYGNFIPVDESRSNVRILAGGASRNDAPSGWPAHVILDGFTFETPSLAGVYTSASDVIVRNCWFVGCRLGVSGNGQTDRMSYYRRSPNRVRVHNCDYTQWPTYEDGVELIAAAGESGKKLFWHRKHANEGLPGKRFIYESGIIGWAALDWEVDHNRIHSVFEAFSAKGTTQSENLRIHDNLFDKLLDNAVEFEDSAQNMSVYRNVVRDTFSPISWQPLRGKPLPGPGFVYQNVFYNTPEHLETFGFRKTAVFKILGPCYGKIQPPGMLIFNNTIFWPGNAPAIGRTATEHHPDQIGFYNNIFAADYCFSVGCAEWEPVEAFVMARNLTGSIDPRAFAHKVMAGKDGIALDDYTQIGFSNVEAFDLSVRPDSPAVGKAMDVPGVALRFKDIGAVQQGDTWYPPVVGPQRVGEGTRP